MIARLIGGPFDQQLDVDEALFKSGTIRVTEERSLSIQNDMVKPIVNKRTGRYQRRLYEAHIWDWKGWYRN